MNARYIPALDGIRGWAVFSVVLFHLSLPAFAWGYLGVDAFFVLSGYLITRLFLERSAAADRPLLADFWARRAKRLFPALIIFLIATSVGMLVLANADEIAAYRSDLVAAFLYVSNWQLLARGVEYFEAFRSLDPLTHLWSLAIEEQFYVLWPLILAVIGAHRLARYRSIVLAASLGAASALAMPVVAVAVSQNAAYLNSFTRAFEPILGGTIALLYHHQRTPEYFKSNLVSRFAVFGLAGSTIFIGFAPTAYFLGGALIFCLSIGAAIIDIIERPGGHMARLLAWRPAVWLGTISYSLYLWHWPLIQLARDRSTNTAVWALAAVVAVAIAYLSQRIIENPVRHLTWRPTPILVTSALALATVAVVLVVALPVPAAETALLTLEPERVSTVLDELAGDPDTSAEPQTEQPPPRHVIGLTGDSVALSLAPAFIEQAKLTGWDIIARPIRGCDLQADFPLTADGDREAWADTCPAVRDTALGDLWDHQPAVDVLVIYSGYAASNYELDGESFLNTDPSFPLDRLPGLGDFVETAIANGVQTVVYLTLIPPPGTESHPFVEFDAALAELEARFPETVAVIDIRSLICEEVCPEYVEGVQIRPDRFHYSDEGAELVGPIFFDAIIDELMRRDS